jgi:hypothetical protein
MARRSECRRPGANARIVFEGLQYCSPKYVRAIGPIPIAPGSFRAGSEYESSQRPLELRLGGIDGHSENSTPSASMPEKEGIDGQVGNRASGGGKLAQGKSVTSNKGGGKTGMRPGLGSRLGLNSIKQFRRSRQ